jgi:predicted O-methyltransferase YrrM
MIEDSLLASRVEQHIEELVPARPDILTEMERLADEKDFPIIGPAVGQLCYQITRLSGARSVFELGSGFGYSTAWFARGVKENGGGVVYHSVWDAELSNQAKHFLGRLGYNHIVRYHLGESVQTLKESKGAFDIVSNDIDKEGYPESLDVIAAKVRSGGVLIVDNLLWHGRIFDSEDQSAATKGVRELTNRIARDPNWIASLLPMRDGLMMALRR